MSNHQTHQRRFHAQKPSSLIFVLIENQSKFLSNFWAKSVVQPNPPEILHAHAIMHVLHGSLDPISLYHAASSLCNISNLPSLRLIIEDRVSRDRLQDLRDTARRAADRLPKRGTTMDEVQETEKRCVVFDTAILHLHFSSSPCKLGEPLPSKRHGAHPNSQSLQGVKPIPPTKTDTQI